MNMSEPVTIDAGQWSRLQERLTRLSAEKSSLQLAVHIMGRLSAQAGTGNAVEGLLSAVTEVIGGTQLEVYYWMDGQLHYANALGVRRPLAAVVDPLVSRVVAERQLVEEEDEFSHTLMLTRPFTRARTWVFPMLVGSELIGVCKMQGMHVAAEELREALPIFFSYAALVFRNEVLSASRLRQANAELEREVQTRRQVEDELRQAKRDLEAQVVQRTAELVRANAQMEDELAHRKRAEAAFQLASSYNRSLIEASLDPLVTIGPDGKITDVNQATEAVTGCSRAELIGTDFADYFTEPHRARAGYRQAFQEGQVRDFALVLRHREGRLTPVLYNAAVYRNPEGQAIGVFAAARDISERLRADNEREKLQSQQRQLQKSESLNRMAAAIAHHFNNQLLCVTINLEMAMQETTPRAELGELLVRALQSARKAAEVSTLMLTYLGQTFAKRESLDLSGACRQNLPMLAAALPKDVTLKHDLPSPGPVIQTNGNLILQILTNLVTNAVEAGGATVTSIAISVRRVAHSDIPATNRFPIDWQPEATDYACLEVTDAGCGIAPDHLEKLFDPFFSTKFTGRGLGLPVVLGIVRAHHGAVTVESTPSQGSTFRVFIPALAAQPVTPPSLPATPAVPSAACSVLVIEDDPGVRVGVTIALRRKGFQVHAADNGLDGVRFFQQHGHNIQCVVCDLTMPRMDGWETLSALRKIKPGLPFILVSGYGETQAMAGEHAEQPQAFLSKPYPFDVLVTTIRRVLAPRAE